MVTLDAIKSKCLIPDSTDFSANLKIRETKDEGFFMAEQFIQLNHRPYPYTDGATIGSLMAENNFDFAAIIVKINGEIVEEDDWVLAGVHAGDNVEIIHLFGGG